MLNQILKHLKNYFETPKFIENDFIIENGTIANLPFLENQYVLIKGSILNDGIYKIPLTGLKNEQFKGVIIGLAIPNEVIELETKIKAYVDKNPASVYISESFGGYSYSKATDKNGQIASWQDVFKKELNIYRKI